ncbi:MFS transporter [Pseudomonas sp. LMG 31766]|uniref:MFS transporter n=1 Tax=Pseudomonas chaetocerotis TaxID=2758695 RepID=UPI001CCC543A|nr:MFS transporter [Pseudomonas chaetocerotis]MBZ9665135.1 MFS transporter [Pseudomonas chaetocerotis]
MKDFIMPHTDSSTADTRSMSAAWWAVISLALGAFGLVTAEFLPISLLTPMAADLGVSNGAVGQAITATAVVAAFAGPLVVLFSGRLDRQKIVWGLMGMLVFSCILSAYASNITVLLIARGLLGFALGSFWAMMAALALRLVPPDKVPRAISIIMMGISLATIFAAPLGAYLGELWGWQATFLAASGIGVVALVIQMLTLPELPATAAPGLASFKAALTRRAVVVGICTGLLVISGHFAALTFIRPFLEEVPRLDVATVSLALLAFGVSGFFGNLAGGAVAARSPAWAVSSCSFLIAAVALTLILFGTQADVAFVAIALWGFAFGAFPVSISIWNARAAADHAESAGALLSSTFQVAIAAGAVLGGLIIDSLDSQAVIVYAATAAFAGAALMFIRGRAIERQRG